MTPVRSALQALHVVVRAIREGSGPVAAVVEAATDTLAA